MSKTKNFIKIIKERELFYQTTDLNQEIEITGLYCGFDATAKSLQIGNLLCLSFLRLAQENDIPTIALLGGATTKVGGDPTDKHETRKKIENDTADEFLSGIQKQIKKLLPNSDMVNNADWLNKLTFTDFLEHVARYMPVSTLLKLEMFANRLENHDPLNLQELLYPLMQGYDFLWLSNHKNCNAQIGGSDQWCNILTGANLISKIEKKLAVGITIPLLTTPDGQKMGKSVNGAIYLDKDLCPIFNFWQFWRNIDDRMVKSCLKKFTLIDVAQIDSINNINEAKELLANEITAWVHSPEDAKKAASDAKTIFVERNLDELKLITTHNNKLAEIMVELNAASTNSQAKTLIEQGAVKIDDQVIKQKNHAITHNKEFILAVGKKKFFKIKVI